MPDIRVFNIDSPSSRYTDKQKRLASYLEDLKREKPYDSRIIDEIIDEINYSLKNKKEIEWFK